MIASYNSWDFDIWYSKVQLVCMTPVLSCKTRETKQIQLLIVPVVNEDQLEKNSFMERDFFNLAFKLNLTVCMRKKSWSSFKSFHTIWEFCYFYFLLVFFFFFFFFFLRDVFALKTLTTDSNDIAIGEKACKTRNNKLTLFFF